MEGVRNRYYSLGFSDIRATIGKTKKRIGKLIEIHNDYNKTEDGPTKIEELEAKWEKHIEKLKKNLAHMKKLRVNFDFPMELLDSRLSTMNSLQLKQASASIGISESHENKLSINSSSADPIINDQASVIPDQTFLMESCSKDKILNENDNLKVARVIKLQDQTSIINNDQINKNQDKKFVIKDLSIQN
ncbi:3207_t:CDS:2, partial [Acaulospora morrowiae]